MSNAMRIRATISISPRFHLVKIAHSGKNTRVDHLSSLDSVSIMEAMDTSTEPEVVPPPPEANGEEVENVDADKSEVDKQQADQTDVVLSRDELDDLSAEELVEICLKKDAYIDELKTKLENSKSNEEFAKKCEEIEQNFVNKFKQQQLEAIRKENILFMRLTLKEQELQDCLTQIEALKNLRIPTNTQLQSYLLDPALNYIFEKMKKEVDNAKAKVEEMQSEMKAWKFSTNSVTGKQLMAKCRQLHQENEELGKMISSGKIAKLESGLAIHKDYSNKLTTSQLDIEEVLMEMEQDIEGFQNTVYHLQQRVKSQLNPTSNEESKTPEVIAEAN